MEKYKDYYRTANLANYSLLKAFAKENRQKPTEAEALMWHLLSSDVLGVKFRRQHIIKDFIADFISLKHNLIIEIDGGYHSLPEQQISDEERTQVLNEQGFKVIRFTNEDILFNADSVLEKIKQELCLKKETTNQQEG